MALERRRFADEPDAWGAPAPRRPAPLGPTPRVPAPVLFAVARVLPARERNYWRANPVDTLWHDAVSCGTETVAVVDAHHEKWYRPPHPDRVERLVLLLAQGDRDLLQRQVAEMVDEVARWGLQPTAVVVRGNPVIPGAEQEYVFDGLMHLFASMRRVDDLEIYGVDMIRKEMMSIVLRQWSLRRLYLSNLVVDFELFADNLDIVAAMNRNPHPVFRRKKTHPLRELTLYAVHPHGDTQKDICPTLERLSRSLHVLDLDTFALFDDEVVEFLRNTLPLMSSLHTLRLCRLFPNRRMSEGIPVGTLVHMVFWAIHRGMPLLRALSINAGVRMLHMDDTPMAGGVAALFKLHDLRLHNVQLSGAVAREIVEAKHTRRLHTLHLDRVSVAPDTAHTLDEVVAALAPPDRRMRDVRMTGWFFAPGTLRRPHELWTCFRGARRLHADLSLLLSVWPHVEASGHTKAMAEVLTVDMKDAERCLGPYGSNLDELCAAFGRMWHLQFDNYSEYATDMWWSNCRTLHIRNDTRPDHAVTVLLEHAARVGATHLTLRDYTESRPRMGYVLFRNFPFRSPLPPHLAIRVFRREDQGQSDYQSISDIIDIHHFHNLVRELRQSRTQRLSLVLEQGYMWSNWIPRYAESRGAANQRHDRGYYEGLILKDMRVEGMPIRCLSMFSMDNYAGMMDLETRNTTFPVWHVPKTWIAR